MNGKRWAALGIAAGLFIFSIMMNVAYSVAFGNFADLQENLFAGEQTFSEKVIDGGTSFNRIVVLEVNGVIQDVAGASSLLQSPTYHHRQFLQMLDQAGEDDSVKGIVIRVNSPGGGVVESAEVHDKIIELKETTKKPVFVSMGSVAASGGYYISATADKIYANPATMTGSLGVIMQSLNYSELADELGIHFETIKSGPYKDIGSPERPMSDEERKILQSMVDHAYQQFVDVIANGRNLDETRVKEIADGRIYDGIQAKELGLIDELGNLDETIAAMKKHIGDDQASVIKYEPSFGIQSFLQMTAEKMFGTEIDLFGIKQLIHQSNSPRLMYLYTE